MKKIILVVEILIIFCIFISGCVLRSSDGTEDDVEGIAVSVREWKEDNTSIGLMIQVKFGNNVGQNIKLIDKVNTKIIYEKDTVEETKVYDKMIEIKEESYIYSALLGHCCNLNIPYSDFNGNHSIITHYTVIVEYKGVSGSGSSNHIISTPVITFHLTNVDSYVNNSNDNELFWINIIGGESVKFSEIKIKLNYTDEGTGSDNYSNQWFDIQIQPMVNNSSSVTWAKNIGLYSPLGQNDDDFWDIGEKFVIGEIGKKDLIANGCKIYVQIIYMPTYEIITEESINIT